MYDSVGILTRETDLVYLKKIAFMFSSMGSVRISRKKTGKYGTVRDWQYIIFQFQVT